MDSDPTRRPNRPSHGREPRRLTLWCGVCGQSHTYTREQASEYLGSGWPECCGRPMGLGQPFRSPEMTNPAW